MRKISFFNLSKKGDHKGTPLHFNTFANLSYTPHTSLKHPYFRTLILSSIFGLALMIFFIVMLSLVYKNPLSSVPKGFDFILYLLVPIGAMLFFKYRINDSSLDFKEGVVMVSLVNFAMIIGLALSIAIIFNVFPNFLTVFVNEKLAEINANKPAQLTRFQTPQDFENYKINIKNTTVWQIIYQEAGVKLMIGFFTAIVSATGFRK